jgi:hypothetical protein
MASSDGTSIAWPLWVADDLRRVVTPQRLATSGLNWHMEFKLQCPFPGTLTLGAFDITREDVSPLCIASISCSFTEDHRAAWVGSVCMESHTADQQVRIWESVFARTPRPLNAHPFSMSWSPSSGVSPDKGDAEDAVRESRTADPRVTLLHRITYHLCCLASTITTLANKGTPMEMSIMWIDSLIPFDPNRDAGPAPRGYPDVLRAVSRFSFLGATAAYSHWYRRRPNLWVFGERFAPVTPTLAFKQAHVNDRYGHHDKEGPVGLAFERLRLACWSNRRELHGWEAFSSDVLEIAEKGLREPHMSVYLPKAGCSPQGTTPVCLVASRARKGKQGCHFEASDLANHPNSPKLTVALAFAQARSVYYASIAPALGSTTWEGTSFDDPTIRRLDKCWKFFFQACFATSLLESPAVDPGLVPSPIAQPHPLTDPTYLTWVDPASIWRMASMCALQGLTLSLPPAEAPQPQGLNLNEFKDALIAAEALGELLRSGIQIDFIVDQMFVTQQPLPPLG